MLKCLGFGWHSHRPQAVGVWYLHPEPTAQLHHSPTWGFCRQMPNISQHNFHSQLSRDSSNQWLPSSLLLVHRKYRKIKKRLLSSARRLKQFSCIWKSTSFLYPERKVKRKERKIEKVCISLSSSIILGSQCWTVCRGFQISLFLATVLACRIPTSSQVKWDILV